MRLNNPRDQLVFILCGLPGSGKTFHAAIKTEANKNADVNTVHLDLNHYLEQGMNMKSAYDKFFNDFIIALRDSVSVIIVDKPNLLEKHRKNYERIAIAFEYSYVNVLVGSFDSDFAEFCTKRSRVPLEYISEQARSVQMPEGKHTCRISKEECGWTSNWRARDTSR